MCDAEVADRALLWQVLAVPQWGQGLQVPPRFAARLCAEVPDEGTAASSSILGRQTLNLSAAGNATCHLSAAGTLSA